MLERLTSISPRNPDTLKGLTAKRIKKGLPHYARPQSRELAVYDSAACRPVSAGYLPASSRQRPPNREPSGKALGYRLPCQDPMSMKVFVRNPRMTCKTGWGLQFLLAKAHSLLGRDIFPAAYLRTDFRHRGVRPCLGGRDLLVFIRR